MWPPFLIELTCSASALSSVGAPTNGPYGTTRHPIDQSNVATGLNAAGFLGYLTHSLFTVTRECLFVCSRQT